MDQSLQTNKSMAIYNRLRVLIAEKELREGRKLTYRVIAGETGISTGTITRYVAQKVDRFDAPILEAFCRYFNCQPGDILVWSENAPWETVRDSDTPPAETIK